MEDWTNLARDGVLIGDASAPIKVIEFMDLQCPFCRLFHAATVDVKRDLGDSMAVVYIHYPVPTTHQHAMAAARASECAGEQGRFVEYIDVVFARQDSLGTRSWTSFAVDAGVSDTVAFASCASQTSPVPRIDRGRELGAEIGITGTPTVIINGWRMPRAPYDSLRRVIAKVAAGEAPYAKGKPRFALFNRRKVRE
jgi:protein-disulfide isomerase